MTKYFLAFITSALLFFNSCSNGQSQSSNTNLSAKEFDKKINQLPGAPVIDVRTPGEFSKGHLQNALNIDWNGDNFETEISKIDKSKPVFAINVFNFFSWINEVFTGYSDDYFNYWNLKWIGSGFLAFSKAKRSDWRLLRCNYRK